MQTFNVTGEEGITVQYSGDVLDVAVSLDANLINPPCQFYVMFTSGVATLVKGVKLTGQTSTNTCRVKAVVVTSGTLAGNDGAGILFLEELSGPITATENLRVSTTTYCIANTTQIDCKAEGMSAKSMFLTVETNTLRINWTGASPTTSAGTPASFGHPITAGQSIEISGNVNVKNFKMINAATASNGVANITIKY
jgi:hypothetical protein